MSTDVGQGVYATLQRVGKGWCAKLTVHGVHVATIADPADDTQAGALNEARMWAILYSGVLYNSTVKEE